MDHHLNCRDFRNLDPGMHECGNEFIERYADRFAQFPIDTYKECLGCCLAYLTRNRNYTRVYIQRFDFYVHFPFGNPPNRYRNPSVTSFVRVPQGPMGVKGQIATGYDYSLGIRFSRPFAGSRTYQMYVPDDDLQRGLSIGFPCNARMESVAIDVVGQARRSDIADIKLNFADAVLVERYKEMSPKRRVTRSFGGYCMTPPGPVQVDPLVEGMQNVAIN